MSGLSLDILNRNKLEKTDTALNSKKVNNFTVETNVPADAKFTDTTYSTATVTTDGLMSSVDKKKLDGIEVNATKYEHPTTHPASIITEETNKRFMTDAEKTKLAGIAAGANNYVHPTGTNPHGTTKADVGLGSVPNYGVATQAEALAGASNAALMTPLRVKEAIERLGFDPSKNIVSGTFTPLKNGTRDVVLGFRPSLLFIYDNDGSYNNLGFIHGSTNATESFKGSHTYALTAYGFSITSGDYYESLRRYLAFK